jgi:hypothetical protein
MPTIDQLAPATATSDTDEVMLSQSGVDRKATLAQVLAGMQPMLAVNSNTLLGRNSAGIGAPEQVSIGSNLSLVNGVLAANATPFIVNSLPAGAVPAAGDLIPLGQSGANTAVTYSQFLSGLPQIANINASQLLVTPTGGKAATTLAQLAAGTLPLIGGALTGPLTLAADPSAALQAATKQYVDAQVGTVLPKTGGTLTGSLTLAADPVASLQAATKEYVDGQVATALPRAGGTLTGALTLAGDPTSTLQPATKQYVDGQVATALPKAGGTLTGALTLAADPATPQQAATKQYVDTRVSRSGDTLTGPLVLAADPTAPLQAATKEYVDSRVLRNGDTLSGALTLAADPVAPLQAATKEYVDTRVFRNGDTLTGALVLAADPVAPLQAATKEYVDNQVGSGLTKAGGTLTGTLTLAADPTASMQAATKHYVDTQVATSLPLAGGTLTGALTLPANPVSALQAAPKQYVDTQVATALPLGGGILSGTLTLHANPTAALQAAPKQYVDTQVVTALPITGGTLTGTLTLAADPTSSLQAATKHYVDANAGANTGVINVRSSPYNAQLNGVTDDTAAFKAAYQAAPTGSVIYVPNGVTVMQNPNTWGISLTKRVKWVVDGTTLMDGTALANAIPGGTGPAGNYLPGSAVGNSGLSIEVSQTNSQSSDFAVQHSSYIVNHTGGPTGGSVICNTRNDTIIYNAPNNYVWGGLDRLLWCGTQTLSTQYPAQHVARYIQTIRQSIGTNSSGTPLPQPQLWAACIEYRDTTGQPSSAAGSASLTVEMDWFGNGPDDANQRQIQSLVVGQNNTSGTPVVVGNAIGVYLAGGSQGNVNRVFNVCIPFAISVLDTTSAQQMSGAAAIRMAAGHSIAFEPTNSCRLSYDSTTNTLRWYQGTLSYVVGEGITVGWMNAYGGSATLPNYIAGNMIFLGGGTPYTITLPPASTVPAGTGFTFAQVGTTNVTIAPSGIDTIDYGPVTLRRDDHYHIVSDGVSGWHEVFRANAVSPVLPSYTVSALPGGYNAGAVAFATNGRKPNEGAGGGTGVQVFFDGSRWISVSSGSQVAA